MDRRKSLKALVVGTVSTGVLIEACKTEKKEGPDSPKEVQAEQPGINRMAEEKTNEDAIKAMPKFFTDTEMATITVLGDIIIPKDAVSGSASDAKVPEFIEFINSINSGTFASLALPLTASFGIMISPNTVMVAISVSVKNFGIAFIASSFVFSSAMRLIPGCSACTSFGESGPSLLSVLQASINTPVETVPTTRAFNHLRLSIITPQTP